MAIKQFDQGASVRVYGVFTNSAGTAVDPTTVKLAYRADAIGLTTILTYGSDAALVRGGTGIYYADLDTNDSSGRYEWNLYSTGTGQAAQNGEFYVRRVLTTPAPPSDPMTTLNSTNVTFLAEGTGAVTRSIRDKARDFVSILDYGASTSASASENATAINLALTAAATYGGAVYVPEGTYNVNALLSVPSGVLFFGAGRLSKIVSSIAAGVSELVRLTGDYAAIENMWLSGTGQGDGSAVNGSRGIWIGLSNVSATRSDYCRVENCIIDQFIGNGISGHYRYCKIINNDIINNTDANLFLEPVCRYNLVQGNRLNGSKYSGIDCAGGDNRLINNYCEANGGGTLDPGSWNGILLASVEDANPCSNNIVVGNYCKDNLGSGIYAFGSTGLNTVPATGNVISNNFASGHTNTSGATNGPAGFAIVGCDHTTVVDNIAVSNRDNYMVSGSGGLTSTGVMIRNNQSITPTRHGYLFVYSPRIDLAGDNPPQRVVVDGNSDRSAGAASYIFITSTASWSQYSITGNRSLSPTTYCFSNDNPTVLADYYFDSSNYGSGAGTGFSLGFDMVSFANLDATPSVKNGRFFKTANGSATSITSLDDGIPGQTIEVLLTDSNTTWVFGGGNLRGNHSYSYLGTNGDRVTGIFDGTNWHCTVHNRIAAFSKMSTSTITQNTSKSTGVTLNGLYGEITTHNANLVAGASVDFALTNSALGANDYISIGVMGSVAADKYHVGANNNGAGAAQVYLRNISGGDLAEAILIKFIVHPVA